MVKLTMTKTCTFPDEKVYRMFLKAMADAGTPNSVVSALRLYETPQRVEEGAWVTVFEVEKVVDVPEEGAN